MEADHEDRAGVAAQFEPGVGRAEQLDEFVMDHLDDLLAGLNALHDFEADGFGFDAFDEVARDLEIHVGLEQRQPHLAQRLADVGLGDLAEAAQVAKGVLEPAA